MAEFSALTAQDLSAIGTGASVQAVTDLAIPTSPPSGLLVPLPDPSPPESKLVMRDVLIAKTRRALDEALQLHMQALYGHEGAGILIDWVVMCETVDADLDKESDHHSLYVATSQDMSSWKLWGMTNAMAKYVYAATG